MRIRKCLPGLAAVVVAGAACSFPTDDSDKVFVTISADRVVVRRGEKVGVYARMYHVVGADTMEIQNVRFAWTTDDPDIATVEGGGLGAADVTGVNSGVVNIAARAVAFERARNANLAIRVSNPVEVDSVRPRIVRWGDTVRVYGVGVDSIFFVTLTDALLLDYPIPGLLPTRLRDSAGLSQALFWVPPPARTGQILYFGNGVFGFADDTTRVLQFDVTEPNDTVWRGINLDAPPIVPVFPALRYFNPALAFEPLRRGAVTGAEWFRFTQGTPRDLTLIIQGTEVRGTFRTFFTDSLYWNSADSSYRIGPDSWTIGPSSHACHGFAFEPPEARPESTIVALRNMPAAPLHAIAIYEQPGRYGLTVLQGYITSSPKFPRDDREEDDFCNAADLPAKIVTLPFRDTLTIDNPHDIDWIRFRVPGPVAQTVQLRTRVLEAAADDSTDIDLYVLTVPGGGASSTLDLRGRSDKAGASDEALTLVLNPGDYYAVVLDYIGTPTRYDICIQFGACTAFPAAQAAPPGGETPARHKSPGTLITPLRAPQPGGP